jgi:predicted RNase H-like HicB family nuclease
MLRNFTLEYWREDGWFVGRLKELPGVFSQAETMAELEENIRDAYRLLKDDAPVLSLTDVLTKEIGVEV